MGKIITKLRETNKVKNDQMATIVNYRNNRDIDVQFENGEVATHKSYMSKTKNNSLYIAVIDYKNYTNMNVQFEA